MSNHRRCVCDRAMPGGPSTRAAGWHMHPQCPHSTLLATTRGVTVRVSVKRRAMTRGYTVVTSASYATLPADAALAMRLLRRRQG